jgi:hypothetical protein
MFAMASQVGKQTKIKELKTSTGTKDTFLDHFLEKLAGSYKKKQGTAAKQAVLDSQIHSLPTNVFSPVWQIKGIWTTTCYAQQLSDLITKDLILTLIRQSRFFTQYYSVL